jgi:hypothetical protein
LVVVSDSDAGLGVDAATPGATRRLLREAETLLRELGGFLMKVDLTALMEFDKVPEMNREHGETGELCGFLLYSPDGRCRLPAAEAGWLSRLWRRILCNREITELEARLG